MLPQAAGCPVPGAMRHEAALCMRPVRGRGTSKRSHAAPDSPIDTTAVGALVRVRRYESSGATRYQVAWVREWPCSNSTGGPWPPCRTRSVAMPASIRSSLKPSNIADLRLSSIGRPRGQAAASGFGVPSCRQSVPKRSAVREGVGGDRIPGESGRCGKVLGEPDGLAAVDSRPAARRCEHGD